MLRTIAESLETIGRFIVFLEEPVRNIFKKPYCFTQVLDEIEHLGVNSLPDCFT